MRILMAIKCLRSSKMLLQSIETQLPKLRQCCQRKGKCICLGDSLSNLRTTLPRKITVDGRIYVLVGYTLYEEGASHFTYTV